MSLLTLTITCIHIKASVHSNKVNPEHKLVSTQLKGEERVRGQYLDRSNNLILKNV